MSDVEMRMTSPVTSIMRTDYLEMKPLLEWMRNVAPRFASGTLLDYGCGNRPYESLFQAGIQKYIGVDVVQNKFNTVSYVVPTNALLPLENDSVDTVLSTQVLEHVSEPKDYIQEVARVLRPGGTFILTCPGTYMLHEEPYDFFRYTKYGLQHLLESHNFEIVRLDAAGGAWRLIGQTLVNHKTFGAKFRVPIIGGLTRRAWIFTANVLCEFLDRFNTNEKDTLNYMVIARKKSGPAR